MTELIEKCKKAGLKITPQRVAVYDELVKAKDHPSAETIHNRVIKQHPHISLDTVNRTLMTFSKIGLASVLAASGDARRFDGDTACHQHFKCVNCGNIIDLYCDKFDKFKLPHQITRKYKVLKKNLYLEGICDLCLEKM